jgi:hypothetical protein
MVHIKNNNLYQKKTKVKTGGAARLPLTDASVNANLRPAIVPETRMTGNVKSLKFNEGTETVINSASTAFKFQQTLLSTTLERVVVPC